MKRYKEYDYWLVFPIANNDIRWHWNKHTHDLYLNYSTSDEFYKTATVWYEVSPLVQRLYLEKWGAELWPLIKDYVLIVQDHLNRKTHLTQPLGVKHAEQRSAEIIINEIVDAFMLSKTGMHNGSGL